jgi:hypothetical protein
MFRTIHVPIIISSLVTNAQELNLQLQVKFSALFNNLSYWTTGNNCAEKHYQFE